MIKKLLFLLLILAPLSTSSGARIDDIPDSICRVSNGLSFGTAWCYKEDDDHYYLITAGHFDGGFKDKTITIDLYHNAEIKRVTGKYVYQTYVEHTAEDMSVIKIDKSEFGSYPGLKPLKLAKSTDNIKTIWSYGCSNGKYPTAYKGKFIGFSPEGPNLMDTFPPVIPGRSGSPVLNENHEVVGMIIMCNGEVTMASTVEKIRTLLKDSETE